MLTPHDVLPRCMRSIQQETSKATSSKDPAPDLRFREPSKCKDLHVPQKEGGKNRKPCSGLKFGFLVFIGLQEIAEATGGILRNLIGIRQVGEASCRALLDMVNNSFLVFGAVVGRWAWAEPLRTSYSSELSDS